MRLFNQTDSAMRKPVKIFTRFMLIAGVAFVTSSCDFEVTNPGPVQDEFLDDDGAHASVVEGANFALSTSLWQLAYHSEESAKQITRSGRNFCCPKVPPRVGDMRRDALDNNAWNVAQQARFVAEDASRRFDEVLGEDEASSYVYNARAKKLAGHANRLLGENMCTAVIDGSEDLGGNDVYLERAKERFEEAVQVGEAAGEMQIVEAAHAGLASVLGPGLNRWDEAVDYANQVSDDFSIQAVYTSSESDQYNIMYDLGADDPWGDWTVYNSFYEEYYEETGDPRAGWVDRETDDTPEGLPLYEQQKFSGVADNVNMNTGREMRLIEAEAELRNGNWEEAMDIINEVRTDIQSEGGEPLEERSAENVEEAWGHLLEERRIEFWLEGRFMNDLRRWIDDGLEGTDNVPAYDEFERMPDVTDRNRLCFPIADSEINSNEHFDQDWEDPWSPIYDGN